MRSPAHAKVRSLPFFVGSLFFVFCGGVVLAINNSFRGRPWRPERERSLPQQRTAGTSAQRTAPCQSLIPDRRATLPSWRPLAAPHQRLILLEPPRPNYLVLVLLGYPKHHKQDSLNTQPSPITCSANFTRFLFHFYPLPCLKAGAWLLFMGSQFLASPHSSPNPSGSTPLVPRESSGQQDDVSSREFRCTADFRGDLLSRWTRRLHYA
mgnify:CR=1 FL=1